MQTIEHVPGIPRRNFLKLITSASVWLVISTQWECARLIEKGNNTWSLSLMPHDKQIKLLNFATKKLQWIMPKGTENEYVRYLAIIPDNKNANQNDLKIYIWTLSPKPKKWREQDRTIQIKDNKWNILFPDAEIIWGVWTGSRIKLNDEKFIIIGIWTPVHSDSLPINARSHHSRTFISSIPPNKAFQTPAMQKEWKMYLDNHINTTFDKTLKNHKIQSQLNAKKSVESIVDKRLIQLFAIVEHMDIVTISDAKNKDKLNEEYIRVLTNYGLNKTSAYRYGKSSAGWRGMMQIIPNTYRIVSSKYNATVWSNFTECVTSSDLSILLSTLIMDDNLKSITRNTEMTNDEYIHWKNSNSKNNHLPLALWMLYNHGTSKIWKINQLHDILKIEKMLPIETQIYLQKIRYVWDKI